MFFNGVCAGHSYMFNPLRLRRSGSSGAGTDVLDVASRLPRLGRVGGLGWPLALTTSSAPAPLRGREVHHAESVVVVTFGIGYNSGELLGPSLCSPWQYCSPALLLLV